MAQGSLAASPWTSIVSKFPDVLSNILSFLPFGTGLLRLSGTDVALNVHTRDTIGGKCCWFEPVSCRCARLCMSHLMNCYCGVPMSIMSARKILMENMHVRSKMSRHFDQMSGSLLWAIQRYTHPVASVHLWWPLSARKTCLALGWSQATNADDLFNSLMSGPEEYGSTWHVEILGRAGNTTPRWYAAGTRLGHVGNKFPFRDLRSLSPTSALSMTAVDNSLALFYGGQLISRVHIPRSLAFNSGVAKTFFVFCDAPGHTLEQLAPRIKVKLVSSIPLARNASPYLLKPESCTVLCASC